MAVNSQPTGRPRPLSPHLQIYRWPVTMLTSIVHRLTGLANIAGALLLTAWLVAAAHGPDTFGMMREVLSSIWGKIVLFGLSASLIYHLLNGIRHLAWDTGAGLSVPASRTTGYLVIAGTIVLTIGIWAAGYLLKGHS